MPSGRPTADSVCGGVLVGEDLVLTAAHCVVSTLYVDGSCSGRPQAGNPDDAPETFGNVVFDLQGVQDYDGRALFSDDPDDLGPAWRTRRMIPITEMVAWPNDFFVHESVEDPCGPHPLRAGIDGVVLRIAEPIGAERGYARMRDAPPATGDVLPVIHLPGNSKFVMILRAKENITALPGAIVMNGMPVVPGMQREDFGSSGAPLFDQDGYVLGVLSKVCGSFGLGDCVAFSSIGALFAEPGFAGFSPAPERPSDSGLGRFDEFLLSDFQLERVSPPLDGIDHPLALAIRPGPDGGFITAGFTTDDGERLFALVGYDEAGMVDPTFSSGGVATHDVPLSSNDQLRDVVYSSVGGTQLPFAVASLGDSGLGETESMALARFTPDGDLDLSFASGGVRRINGSTDTVPSLPTSGAAIAVDPRDGMLVIAGHATVGADAAGSPQGSPVVARFDTDGNLDVECNNGVFTWRPFGRRLFFRYPSPDEEELTPETFFQSLTTPTWDMVVTDVTVDSLGRIVLVGYLHQGQFHARVSWIGRLNEDCTPDATFGPAESGVITFGSDAFASSPAAENGWLSAVVIEPVTNRIFVGGTITAFDTSHGIFAGRMFVAAFLPDGSVDATFGTMGGQGGVVMSSEGWHDELHGLAYLAPGATGDEARLILAGESYRDEARTTRRVRMVSFLMDGSLDESAYPLSTPASGVVDAWATDVAVTSGREVFVSVVHRSDGT